MSKTGPVSDVEMQRVELLEDAMRAMDAARRFVKLAHDNFSDSARDFTRASLILGPNDVTQRAEALSREMSYLRGVIRLVLHRLPSVISERRRLAKTKRTL